MGDRDWLVPAALLTLLSLICGLFWFPRISEMHGPEVVSIFFIWYRSLVIVAGAFALIRLGRLAISGDPKPIASLRASLPVQRVSMIMAGAALVALNLTGFGIIKPQLAHLRPFNADPLLADIDSALFGADPWTLLSWFDHSTLPEIYHAGWFAFVLASVFFVILTPAGTEKARLLITYFALWTVGPVIHLLLPAAGPVFFEALGYGDRFAGLVQHPESRDVSTYLWEGYIRRTYNAAGGISAMPSLHLATMAWCVIALRKSPLFFPSIAFTIYMLFGSVVLGFHYAIDGLIGIAMSVAIWLTTKLATTYRGGLMVTRRAAIELENRN